MAGQGGVQSGRVDLGVQALLCRALRLRLRLRGAPSDGDERGVGSASAARVSLGSEAGIYHGLNRGHAPTRDASQHVTVTVTLYNAVEGGVPAADDVARAVDDLESLYAACSTSGRLADSAFDFMKDFRPTFAPPSAGGGGWPA